MKTLAVATWSITLLASQVESFVSLHPLRSSSFRQLESDATKLSLTNQGWDGEVVSNEGGAIRGCSLTPVGDSVTEWTITIDGVEADLGNFGLAIYKKLLADSKQQQFQGFRPGTVPPHLLKTYKAFAMNECARETVLEAMQQNNLRPFTDARQDMQIGNVSIPPPIKKKAKKKKSKKRKSKQAPPAPETEEAEPVVPQWLAFDGMDGAIDAGWEPGQSFSFVATNVKGQKVLTEGEVSDAKPLGLNY